MSLFGDVMAYVYCSKGMNAQDGSWPSSSVHHHRMMARSWRTIVIVVVLHLIMNTNKHCTTLVRWSFAKRRRHAMDWIILWECGKLVTTICLHALPHNMALTRVIVKLLC